jgi:proliferating cell nuclear antigen
MIELKRIDFFRRSVDAISSFIPEGNFRFSDKGVYFRSTDPSQVVLVDYFIDKKLFDKYEIEPNFIGVDLVELNKMLQRAMITDKLFIDISDAELKLKFESEMKRTFRLPLIDGSVEEAKVPAINYDTKIEIMASFLKELLKDALLFGSSVVLKVEGGRFFIEARGSQGALDSEALKTASVSSKSNVTSKFSLGFFQNIIKEADNEKKVVIYLKNDSPMKIEYNIGESKITFYLAHMIL